MNNNSIFGEEEIVLAPPTGLLDEAKEISLNTIHDEKFPFVLHYNPNQKNFLLSLLGALCAIVEEDNEECHTISTWMNMTQLAFIKRSNCIECVKTDEGINPFMAEDDVNLSADSPTGNVVQETIVAFPEAQNELATPLSINATPEAITLDGSASSVAASVLSSCGSHPANTDMAHAQEITVETLVSGCICCPGAEQWFKFSVPSTKEYTIFTTGSLDTIGTLSGCCLSKSITNDDCAGRVNFRIVETLCVGYDYYIKVGAKNDATGSYTLKVTTQSLAEEVLIHSKRNDGIVVLEKGKTYELPRGEGYGFLNVANTENAPLSVEVNPNSTTDKRVYWYASSIPSNPVDTDLDWYDNTTKYQTIKANSCGGTKLYAYDWFERGKRGEIFVAVVPNGGSLIKATGISLDHASLTLDIGEYQKIIATVSPSNATVHDVEWVSDNPNIATVTPYGRVKAIAPGTTKIRAKSMTGAPVIESVCNIAVLDPLVDGTPIIVKCSGGLSVMSTASGGTLLGTFANGSTIYLVDETPQNETMFKVYGTMTNGNLTYGWCSGEYLEKETTFLKHIAETKPSYVRNNCSLNDDNIVGEISYGMQVELVQEKAENNDGYDWHKIIYNDKIAYIAHFSGRFETVVRWAPLRCYISAIVADRYLGTEEKRHNAKIIYNYLTYKGWSRNAICGAIANMEAESTLSPGIWERQKENDTSEPAFGLLQWDPPTKWTNYAEEHNYEQDDIYRQLDYFIYSTRYGGGEWSVDGVPEAYQLYAYEYACSNRSVHDLAIAFLLCYERPTDSGTSVREQRASLAEVWETYFDSIGW